MICPKCQSNKFRDVICNLDMDDGEVEIIDKVCNNCSLWYDSITKQFYENVKTCIETEDKIPYVPVSQ